MNISNSRNYKEGYNMKKLLSVFLAAIMIFSFASVAFAGSWNEEQANVGIKEYCTNCNNPCTGEFGCTCCELCPGHIDENGNATNTSGYLPCHYDFYLDVDILDADGNIIHKGDQTTHYYWKAKCCDACTGKVGCKCDCKKGREPNCPYCIDDTKDDVGDKIEDGIHKGQLGYINGIQKALTSMRDVMYKLFDALFKFLRLDEILGKWPSQKK